MADGLGNNESFNTGEQTALQQGSIFPNRNLSVNSTALVQAFCCKHRLCRKKIHILDQTYLLTCFLRLRWPLNIKLSAP